jgi:hypothetical protein
VTTIADWLSEREPVPPPALVRRLRDSLGPDLDRDARDAVDACLDAGQRLVASVLSDEGASRDSALDLLAADALVTYAFEAASDRPNELSERAARAMSDIAALGMATP